MLLIAPPSSSPKPQRQRLRSLASFPPLGCSRLTSSITTTARFEPPYLPRRSNLRG
jgi:hypothetical protein